MDNNGIFTISTGGSPDFWTINQPQNLVEPAAKLGWTSRKTWLTLHCYNWLDCDWTSVETSVELYSLKLTWPLKMDGWDTSFLLGWPIFRGELFVSGRVPPNLWVSGSCGVFKALQWGGEILLVLTIPDDEVFETRNPLVSCLGTPIIRHLED